MGRLCWSKHSSAASCGQPSGGATSSAAKASEAEYGSGCCCCLWRLVRKLKKHSRMLRSGGRASPFQCRYDPLSYSLNFDSSGCGSLVDEDNYYHFYAFSSRFVANPTAVSRPTLLAATH